MVAAWNRVGRPIVHAASNFDLACLETVVHLTDSTENRTDERADKSANSAS